MRVLGAILAFAASVAAGCAAERNPEAASNPETAHALSERGGRLFLAASVNGAEANALLDSAAEISLVDKSFAEAAGLTSAGEATVKGSGGEEPVTFAENVTIASVGKELSGLTVAVLDLSDLSSRLIGEKVDLILGRELFDSGRLAIDIARGAIAFVARDAAPEGVELTLTAQHGVEAFEVSVGGRTVLAEFDLGNGSEVLIGKSLATELGLLGSDRPVEKRAGGGLGGAIERDIVVIPSLTIAGVSFENVEAAVDPLDNAADLNVGVSMLRRYRITTDFEQRKIWLKPLG